MEVGRDKMNKIEEICFVALVNKYPERVMNLFSIVSGFPCTHYSVLQPRVLLHFQLTVGRPCNNSDKERTRDSPEVIYISKQILGLEEA